MVIGFFYARSVPHWAEDRYNEFVVYSFAEWLSFGDVTGLFGGCFSVIPSFLSELRLSLRLAGCIFWILFLLGTGLLAVAIPIYPFWEGAGIRAIPITLITMPLQPAFWVLFACWTIGHVLGIITQKEMFKDR